MVKPMCQVRQAQVFDLDRLAILAYRAQGKRIVRDEFKATIKAYPSAVVSLDESTLAGYMLTMQFSGNTLLLRDFYAGDTEVLVKLLDLVLAQARKANYRAIYTVGTANEPQLPGFKPIHKVDESILYVTEL